tara:strand:+ start:599 stop:841 length:243 start_codon:yes stop_codon:yes gene_type:complete
MSYKYRIYRHPAGICLNGKEFISKDNGDIMLFNTIGMAKMWIKKQDPAINLNAEDLMSEYGLDIEQHSPENDYYYEEIET